MDYDSYEGMLWVGADDGYGNVSAKIAFNGTADPAITLVNPPAGMNVTRNNEGCCNCGTGIYSEWTQNSDGTLRFRTNGEFNNFTGVKVDGVFVSADNYIAQSGSTIIVFKSSYLKSLSVGTHKITVVYTDGECSADFEVKQAVRYTESVGTSTILLMI